MDSDRRNKEKEQTAEEVKAFMLDKLHEERKYWTDRLTQERKRNEKMLAEVKQASNNLLSAIVRTYGKQDQENDTYILSVPIPEEGYITAGQRKSDKYVLKCMNANL